VRARTPAARAIQDLALGVDTRAQAIAAPRERALDARDLDHVDAATDDQCGLSEKSRLRA
jgi:hypothetical protein